MGATRRQEARLSAEYQLSGQKIFIISGYTASSLRRHCLQSTREASSSVSGRFGQRSLMSWMRRPQSVVSPSVVQCHRVHTVLRMKSNRLPHLTAWPCNPALHADAEVAGVLVSGIVVSIASVRP